MKHIQDPIIEQVREHRLATEASFDHDWQRLMEHYHEVQRRLPKSVLREPKRLPAMDVPKI